MAKQININKTYQVYISGFLLFVGAIILDLTTELGVASGIAYIPAVILGLLTNKNKYFVISGLAGIIFTLIGFYISPDGGELWKVLINRFYAIFAITVITIFCVRETLVKNKVINVKKELEERIQKLEGLAYDTIWEWNVQDGYLKWFGDIDTLLGYEKNEFPRTIAGWEAIIHPDDKKRVLENLKKHHDEHLDWHEEYRVVKKDGSIRWWDDYGETYRNEDDKSLLMTGTIKDITEKKENEKKLKESEERFRIVAGLSYDIIWQWDIVSGYLNWFGDIDSTLGYEKNEFPRTIKAFEGIIHPDDRERVMKNLDKHLKNKMKWHEIYRVIKKNGSVRWWDVRGETKWDKDGTPLVMTGAIMDITKLKNSEKDLESHRYHLEKLVTEQTQKLEISQKMLLHSEKLSSLGRLAASIAHEFNNPIQGIRNTLEILNSSGINENKIKLGQLSIKECDRMAKVIQGLGDFYKPTSTVNSYIDINKCLEEVVLLTDKNLKEKGILVNYDFSKNIPNVPVVEDQIKQVLLNLIQNASDSISNGGQIILITEYLETQIIIKIQDTGHGISKEDQSKIFEPFFTTKDPEKGSGLGLSVSYGIIQDHGGNLKVESDLGKGSTFTINLNI